MKIMDLRVVLLPALCCLLLAGCTTAPDSDATKVFIVRHAEKAAGDDPALTAAGRARADALANLLSGEDVARIFSTDTRRTRSTAAPLAKRLGLEIAIYDHREPAKLAVAVRRSGQSALIVGHSNTIADIASRLGADPGEPVSEDEYDRLYVIRLSNPAVSEIRRYGNDSL